AASGPGRAGPRPAAAAAPRRARPGPGGPGARRRPRPPAGAGAGGVPRRRVPGARPLRPRRRARGPVPASGPRRRRGGVLSAAPPDSPARASLVLRLLAAVRAVLSPLLGPDRSRRAAAYLYAVGLLLVYSFQEQHRRAVLGLLWMLATPVLFLAVYLPLFSGF